MSITEAVEDPSVREELARILEVALDDAKKVLADPRGLDVLLDAIITTFRDAANLAAQKTMSDDEAFAFVRKLHEEQGVPPKLKQAYEDYLVWEKAKELDGQ